MSVLSLAKQVGEPEFADRGLQAFIDRALDQCSDLVDRVGRGTARGGTRERAQHISDRDLFRATGEAIPSAGSTLSDDQSGSTQLADDLFEVAGWDSLPIRDDLRRGVATVCDVAEGA